MEMEDHIQMSKFGEPSDDWIDLEHVLEEVPANEHLLGKEYWKWEDGVATACILLAGYSKVEWYNLESAKFGPLVRGVSAYRNGVKETASYC